MFGFMHPACFLALQLLSDKSANKMWVIMKKMCCLNKQNVRLRRSVEAKKIRLKYHQSWMWLRRDSSIQWVVLKETRLYQTTARNGTEKQARRRGSG